MRGLTHKVRGVVTLTVTGAEPETFLNECARQGVLFWGTEPVDPVTLRFKLHTGNRRRAEVIAARLMCELRAEGEAGVPFFLLRLSRRYGFLAGMAGSLLAVLLMSQVIFTVQVEGNSAVPSAVILSELRRLGVRPGAFGPRLDEGQIAQQALTALDGLSWMAINLNGTRANVLVRERVEKPELEQAGPPADVVAEVGGILTHVEAWRGEALLQVGDTVAAGDTVISGWVPFEAANGETSDTGGQLVRAEGRVEARTWRQLTAVLPAGAEIKSPTGREETRFSLCVLGKRVNFYRNSGISFAEYDKIIRVKTVTLPGGFQLPISLIRETVREVELFSAGTDRAGCVSLLETCLLERLGQLLEEGEILTWESVSAREGGLWKVSLLAECREEIGRTEERAD